jgi:hypothetical protein
VNGWIAVLSTAVLCYALKLSGYLVPQRVLESPRISAILPMLTVALLAALVTTQTLGSGNSIVLDARLPAIAVAAGLYAVKTPFIVVVAAAALVAAGIRLLA